MRKLAIAGGLVYAAALGATAVGAVPNSLMLHLANTVSGGQFLDKGRADTTLGRLEGNGQNWFQFLVVQGDPLDGGQFKNTLDLRGWKVEWAYDKKDPTDPNRYGSGTMEFTNASLWAAVPVGTILTINEWEKAWYLTDTPLGFDPAGTGGLKRDGGLNGLGTQRGNAYNPAIHTLRDFSEDLQWNPFSSGSDGVFPHETGDWRIHVYAGERNPDSSFKYFNFTGSVVDGDPSNPIQVGTDDGGLFAINNDNWQWTIRDAGNNVIQGPFGESGTGLGSTWNVGSVEVVRLENFPIGINATRANYLNAGIADYRDGSSSTYSQPSTWSSGAAFQDLSPMRSWLRQGDANLDGAADGADFLA
ncbi:MAG TPA: hypothetical protein PJ982_18455, partial [Lacipirellulaceae bacterium]|nr:hypothetical protein [Lacipirellulaceae bacterium]